VLVTSAGYGQWKCSISAARVTDAVLDYLTELPKLRELVLWETAITSGGANRLRNFKVLRYLDLDKTAVTPEARH
jgi:hypothetical protein